MVGHNQEQYQGNGFVRQLFQDALDDANNNMMIAQDRGTLMICDTIDILHVRKYTEKNHCELCSKKLQPIKDNRANGGMGSDWKGRRFHIKCWKALNEADY